MKMAPKHLRVTFGNRPVIKDAAWASILSLPRSGYSDVSGNMGI